MFIASRRVAASLRARHMRQLSSSLYLRQQMEWPRLPTDREAPQQPPVPTEASSNLAESTSALSAGNSTGGGQAGPIEGSVPEPSATSQQDLADEKRRAKAEWRRKNRANRRARKAAELAEAAAKGKDEALEGAVKAQDNDPVNDDELMEAFTTESLSRDTLESPSDFVPVESGSFKPAEIVIRPVESPRPEAKVARLSGQLSRVLFSPGVHFLRDPRTGVMNFPGGVGRIPRPEQFAFHRLPQYITASEDDELAKMAESDGIKFVGSTSTLTSSLAHIYFTLSGDKDVDISQLSQDFADKRTDYTAGAQLPAAMLVRLLPNGRYAVDNNKELQIDENILSDYGRILEKRLTSDHDDFKRFLLTSPEEGVSEAERNEREAYAYSRGSTLLMRSQLDCKDIRLPGNGTFDIKTRATHPIRMDRANYKANAAYVLDELSGSTGSFEREYYDLTRSGMLKYCFQARIGQMDGIFVAYHNTLNLFGFQYLPLSEIDKRLFGSTEMGQQVFQVAVALLERLLELATSLFPNQTISLNLSRTPRTDRQKEAGVPKELVAVVQPTEWDRSGPRPTRAISLVIENELDGQNMEKHVFEFSSDPAVRQNHKWVLNYKFGVTKDEPEGYGVAHRHLDKQMTKIKAMNSLYLPEGKSFSNMRREMRKKAEVKQATAGTEAKTTSDDIADEATAPRAAAETKDESHVEAAEPDMNDPFNLTGEAITAEQAAELAAATKHDAAKSGDAAGPATIRWMIPNERIMELRAEAKRIGAASRARMLAWPEVSRYVSWSTPEKECPGLAERLATRRKERLELEAAERAERSREWEHSDGADGLETEGVPPEGTKWRASRQLKGKRGAWSDRHKGSRREKSKVKREGEGEAGARAQPASGAKESTKEA